MNKGDFEDNYIEFIKGSYCFGIPFTQTFGVQKYEYKDGTPFYEIDIDDLRQTDYEAFLRTEEKEDVASFIFEQLDIPIKSGISTYTKILNKMEEERLEDEEEELKLKRIFFLNIFEREKGNKEYSNLIDTHIQNDLVQRIRDEVLFFNRSNSDGIRYVKGQTSLGPKFLTNISVSYKDNTWYDIYIGSPLRDDYIFLQFITNIHEVIYIIYHCLDHEDKQVTEELLNRMIEREEQRRSYMYKNIFF